MTDLELTNNTETEEKTIQKDRVYTSSYNGEKVKCYESQIFEPNDEDSVVKMLKLTTDLYGNLLRTDIDDETYLYSYDDSPSESRFAAKSQSVAALKSKDKTTYIFEGLRLKSITDSKRNSSKTFIYKNKLLSKVSTYNSQSGSLSALSEYTYDNYGNRIKKTDSVYSINNSYQVGNTHYIYSYGGRLKYITSNKSDTISYGYNHQGVRNRKTINGKETRYYLDGNKILAEQREEFDKTIYHYGIEGMTGFQYRFSNYIYVYDCEGNISMIYRPDYYAELARYEYDAFGNCTVYDGNNQVNTNPNFIGNINPFRWKGHYYDVETGLYYINGRYYDPTVGAYLDSAPISTVFDNALIPFALDRTGLMCNNVMELETNQHNVETSVPLSVIHIPLTEETPQAKIPWWHWLLGGIILVGTFALVALTCGAGAAFLGMAAGAAVGGLVAGSLGLSTGEGIFFGALLGGLAAAIFNLLSIVATALGDIAGSTFIFDKITKAVAVVGGMNVTATVTVTGAQAIAAVGTLTALGTIVLFARIGKSGGYRIDHHYPNDHDPVHVHISGDDGITRVDINGNPIQNDRPMTPGEKKGILEVD